MVRCTDITSMNYSGQQTKLRYGREHYELRNQQLDKSTNQVVVKEKPNFKPTGLLAKESNNIGGIQLKYTEPQDGCGPPKNQEYILYIFHPNTDTTNRYNLNTKHFHLIGRDEKVVDLKTDDDTCSKQHAVIQFRERPEKDPNTLKTIKVVKPYIIDLESSNGTFLNGEEIPTSRFIELRPEDVVKFGDSETDYVLMTL